MDTQAAPVSLAWQDRMAWLFLVLFGVLQVCLVLSFPGTYDAGDSVMHFQFARYVPQHPENLFNHWAKPFFTLMASPFAQFGFQGIKFMQCAIALLSAWMGFRWAKSAGYRYPVLFLPLLLASTEYFLAQFSGLTEPLFGLMLLMAAERVQSKKEMTAAWIVSFLPFVRTEGFVIMLLYGVFFAVQGKWRLLPWLCLGSVVYSLFGMWVHGVNPLWIFTENPYGGAELDNYGQGSWSHYFIQYTYAAGLPIAILTWLGILWTILALVFRNRITISGLQQHEVAKDWNWTILLPFMVYFGLHSFLWATGKGHSFGMTRVLIAILPLGALLALQGTHGVLVWASRWRYLQIAWISFVVTYVMAFPFLLNPASLHLPEDLQPSSDQLLLAEAGQFLQSKGISSNRPVYASHPSAAFYLDVDPFDTTSFRNLTHVNGVVTPGSIMIWDGWFSPMEDGVSPDYWRLLPDRFGLLWSKRIEPDQAEVRIYERK